MLDTLGLLTQSGVHLPGWSGFLILCAGVLIAMLSGRVLRILAKTRVRHRQWPIRMLPPNCTEFVAKMMASYRSVFVFVWLLVVALILIVGGIEIMFGR